MRRIKTVKSKLEFEQLFNEGRSLASRGLVLYFIPTQQKGSRVAFCVGKKMGNAVKRNKIRRRLKEAFYQIEENTPVGYNFAWVARKKIEDMDYLLLQREMMNLLQKAILRNEEQ